MNKTLICLLTAGIAASALTTDAFAAKRRHVRALPAATVIDGESIPLTVNRRSWLDPGNAVSTTQGAGPSYIAANTVFNRTQDRIFAPDKFGNDAIQGQPYVPGRTQPVVEGSTLPNGAVVVDNVLLPQNFYFNPAPDLPYGP